MRSLTGVDVDMPTKEKIEEMAYLLWEKEGRPLGRDVNHYLEAERILRRMEDAEREARVEAAQAVAGHSATPVEEPPTQNPAPPPSLTEPPMPAYVPGPPPEVSPTRPPPVATPPRAIGGPKGKRRKR